MHTKFLLDTLRNIPAKPFKDYGFVITFDEILIEMAPYGWNKDMLELELDKLEKAHKIKLAKDDDLIWGVIAPF